MNEIRLVVALKNNILLKKMEEYGYYTNASFAKECNIYQASLGQVINLNKKAVFTKSGEYTKDANRIATFFNDIPENLFPPDLYKFNEMSKANIEVPLESVKMLNTSAAHEQTLENKMLHKDINSTLAILPKRTQKIIRMKFYENLTDQKIGEEFGMSKSNVSQIIRNGLKKLKESKCSQHLLEYIV